MINNAVEKLSALLSKAGLDCAVLPADIAGEIKNNTWARSILVTVGRRGLADMRFTSGGVTICDTTDYPVADDEKLILTALSELGFRGESDYSLPQKTLAVRSGLCEAGRNNLAFSPKYGSFISLSTYLTDLPSGDFIWRGMTMSENCGGCQRCVEGCPAHAIPARRTLIDSSRCMTRQLQDPNAPPDGFPLREVSHINGCMRCQNVCPMNAAAYREERLVVDFDEDETARILALTPFDSLDDSVRRKLERLDIVWSYYIMGRNLRLMFEAAETEGKA